MKDADELKQALEGLGPGFKFVRELGRGTTAIVYLVEDDELGRKLAVKVIRSSFVHDDEAMARLQREARLVAQMQHPNIVKLFGTRHLPDGSMALLMEHVPGRNLREVLQDEGALTASRALQTMKEVSSALAYAHRRRIVHRDVKPENIYIDEEIGTARLADFGVARPWDRDARLTLPGESLGTPAYMSPEQIDAQEVDGRSDVYSLGLVGYEMLAGSHPWDSENLYSVIFKQKHEQLPPLHTIRPDVPDAFVEALRKALHKDPEGRWETAEAFNKELGRIRIDEMENPFTGVLELTGEPGAAATSGPTWESISDDTPSEAWTPSEETRLKQRRRRRRRRLALVGIPLVLAAAGVTWASTRPGGLFEGPGLSQGDGRSGVEAGESTLPPEAPGGADRSPSMLVLLGDSALGVVGSELGDTLTVRLRDASGVPAAGQLVSFEIVQGGGTLGSPTATTDSSGIARSSLLLPESAGPVVVFARVPDEPETVARFDVTAMAGLPEEIVPIGGRGQAAVVGEFLPSSLGVQVIDAYGNPVPDATVSFEVVTGGGRATPSVTRTDSTGTAVTRWRLGDALGTQRIAASAADRPEASQIFEATAQPAAPTESTPDPEPPPNTRPTAPSGPVSAASRTFAVGGVHVCQIEGRGSVFCRGQNSSGQASRPGVTLVAVVAGLSHTCGLEQTGIAHCWGNNEYGQLGDGTTSGNANASPVESDFGFVSLTAGEFHTCGLDGGGGLHCWGGNSSGQLGNGTQDGRSTPGSVSGNRRFRSASAGFLHTCAVETSGSAYCWGLNSDGQLGDGSGLDRRTPTGVAGGRSWSAVTAGRRHTCGVSGGEVLCWGSNGNGQLGDGSNASRANPTPVTLPSSARSVAAGANHTCALLDSGAAWCWGANAFGQLGDGTQVDRTSPVEVTGSYNFAELYAGGGLTCGVRGDGLQLCWGFNQFGQLGDGTRTNRPTPTPVSAIGDRDFDR